MSVRSLLMDHVVVPLRDAQGSPTSIARGAALGTWVAFTPTVGVQMFVVGALGIPLRANIPVALALVWLSNPFTMVPLYFSFYLLGTFVLARPSLGYAVLNERLGTAWQTGKGEGLGAGLHDLFEFLGWEVVWPMAVGSFIMATAVAVPAYHWVLIWAQRRLRRIEREKHEAEAVQAVAPAATAPPVGAAGASKSLSNQGP